MSKETWKSTTSEPVQDATQPTVKVEQADATPTTEVAQDRTCRDSWLNTIGRHFEAAGTKKYTMIGYGMLLAIIVTVLLGVVLAFAGKGGDGLKLTSELKAAAEARTTLVVGINDVGYPPFIFEGYNGKYTGTDYDLMKEVCKAYGWTLEVKPIDWMARSELLVTGEVDCLWGGFNSYGREDVYAWTTPYQDDSDVIVVLSSNKDITVIEDLEDKTVAAITGSTASAALEQVGLAMKRMGCASPEQCFETLKDGSAQVAVMSGAEAATLKGVTVLTEKLEYRTYAVACAPDNTTLRDLIQIAFTD